MDQHKFADVIRQFPQVWDRSHPHFRDKRQKEKTWVEIGIRCGISEAASKELFKALREKYLREREKSKQLGCMYVQWPLLDALRFLEPHILLRKQSANYEHTIQTAEELSSAFNIDADMSCTNNDFESNLIQLVKKCSPIWNRDSKTFSSKQLKLELWKNIARKVNRDTQHCILRWKALREKYIRQKMKFHEGEGKWHLLQEMSFLDEVIKYRRRNSEKDSVSPPPNENSMQESLQDLPQNYEGLNSNFKYHGNNIDGQSFDRLTFDSENSTTDLPNEFAVSVKQENNSEDDVPDSSYDATNSNMDRKRSCSGTSENDCTAKFLKSDDQPSQSQEQLFGNLVAVMLSKKTEKEKNIAMVEIMKILTK